MGCEHFDQNKYCLVLLFFAHECFPFVNLGGQVCSDHLQTAPTQIANVLAVLWHSFGIFGFLLALRKPSGLTVVWLSLSIGASNIWLSYSICLVNQKTGQRVGSSIRDGMACLWQARRLSKERQHLIPYMDVFWMCFGIFLLSQNTAQTAGISTQKRTFILKAGSTLRYVHIKIL